MAYLKFVNKNGVPALESKSVSLTTSGETFIFNYHPYVKNYFLGLLLFKISGTPTAPSTPVGIYFETENAANSQLAVLNAQGTQYTTATWPGDGVYLGVYDRTSDKLQLL